MFTCMADSAAAATIAAIASFIPLRLSASQDDDSGRRGGAQGAQNGWTAASRYLVQLAELPSSPTTADIAGPRRRGPRVARNSTRSRRMPRSMRAISTRVTTRRWRLSAAHAKRTTIASASTDTPRN